MDKLEKIINRAIANASHDGHEKGKKFLPQPNTDELVRETVNEVVMLPEWRER